MAWRLAKSLATLREQINALSPNRSKISDGTIGDAAHASRSSDHNPWVKDGKSGIVTALDITDDAKHGIDSRALGEALIASCDPRIKYVIADGEICSGAAGPSPWTWRRYTGKNSHHHHVHLSVQSQKALYDDASPFDLSAFGRIAPSKVAKPVSRPANPTLSLGAKGPDVDRLQGLLIRHGAKIARDSDYGPKTLAAVKAFQRSRKLVSDGVVGPYTWAALDAAL